MRTTYETKNIKIIQNYSYINNRSEYIIRIDGNLEEGIKELNKIKKIEK